MKNLLTLLFLFPSLALAAVTEEGTAVVDSQDGATEWSSLDVNYITTASCELLIASMGVLANDEAINIPVWDVPTANESFTLIDQTTNSGLAGDMTTYTWGLISPTVKTANVNFLPASGTINTSGTSIQCFKGVDTASVAAATTFIDECVNDVNSIDCVISSGGTSGNLLYAAVTFRGGDQDPITFNGWTEIVTASGTSTNFALMTSGTKNAASALDWDSQTSDENAGHMIDLVVAPSGGAPLRRRHMQ